MREQGVQEQGAVEQGKQKKNGAGELLWLNESLNEVTTNTGVPVIVSATYGGPSSSTVLDVYLDGDGNRLLLDDRSLAGLLRSCATTCGRRSSPT